MRPRSTPRTGRSPYVRTAKAGSRPTKPAGRPRCSTATGRTGRTTSDRWSTTCSGTWPVRARWCSPRTTTSTSSSVSPGQGSRPTRGSAGLRRQLADVLGFRLDEWDFRVLFRSIVNQEGDRRKEHTHVAVQIDPKKAASIERMERELLEKLLPGQQHHHLLGQHRRASSRSCTATGSRSRAREHRGRHPGRHWQPASGRRPSAEATLSTGVIETADLLDLVIAERVVLLYSPSGAGKSSLIAAGLVRQLEAEGFEVLPLVRLTHEAPPGSSLSGPPRNRYVLSTLLSLEEGLAPEHQRRTADLDAMTVTEYLASWPDLDDKPQRSAPFRPVRGGHHRRSQRPRRQGGVLRRHRRRLARSEPVGTVRDPGGLPGRARPLLPVRSRRGSRTGTGSTCSVSTRLLTR